MWPSQRTLGPDLVVGAEPGADRDEPSERVLDRDAQRVGPLAVGELDVGVLAPAERRSADRLQQIGELLVVGRLGAAAGGPDDDRTGRPRGLQLQRPGRVLGDGLRRQLGAVRAGPSPGRSLSRSSSRSATASSRSRPLRPRTVSRSWSTRDDQRRHHPPGRGGVAVDEVDLLLGGAALGHRPDRHLEFERRVAHDVCDALPAPSARWGPRG